MRKAHNLKVQFYPRALVIGPTCTEMRNSFFSLTKCALCIIFLYKGKGTSSSFVWNSQPIPAPGGENIAEPS